jgi:putative membrane protein
MVDVLALVNQAEVEAGMLARDSAQNAEVKAFARRMVQEHSGAMRQEGELVQSAGITGATISTTQGDSTVKGPTVTGTGAASTLQSMHSQTMDRLRSADGAAFDRAYIESEVAVHQQALDLLQRMQGQVQNAQLKEHVTKLIPVVQSHLDRARQLQSSLGTGGTTDTGRTATDTARKG